MWTEYRDKAKAEKEAKRDSIRESLKAREVITRNKVYTELITNGPIPYDASLQDIIWALWAHAQKGTSG